MGLPGVVPKGVEDWPLVANGVVDVLDVPNGVDVDACANGEGFEV